MSFQILLPTLDEPFIRPTKSDWERLRPYICESYKSQHTVRQIREALLAHGYGVSERMLKGRLAKWDMTHKNNTFKPHHVQAIIRKGQQCVEQGKTPPVFVINGRKRTYDDAVKLYCRWKRTQLPSPGELSERPSTPVDLIELDEDTEIVKQERILAFSPLTDDIPRLPSLSPEAHHEVRTLSSVGNWYEQNGSILLDVESWHHCCPIYFLLENCMTAMQSAQTYGVKSEWTALRDLKVKAEKSMAIISTSSFLNALRWFSLFEHSDSNDSVSRVVMNMLSKVAVERLGQEHPLALLFGSAASAPISTELVARLWSLTENTMVSQTSGAQKDDFLGHSLARVGAIMSNLGAYDVAESYLSEGEEVGSSASEWKVLGCTRWLKGRLRRLQGRHDEGIEILQAHDVFLREHGLEGTFLGVAVLEDLGKCNADLGQWDRAETFYSQAVQLFDRNGSGSLSRKISLLRAQNAALLVQGKEDHSIVLQATNPEAFDD